MAAVANQLTDPLASPSDRQNPWAARTWRIVAGVSIRAKIMGIVLALTTVLGVGITLQVRTVMENVFLAELDNRGMSVVSDLSARSVDPILLNDTYAVYELLTDTIANHPDALYAYVRDDGGQVLAHTFGDAGFPTALLALDHPAVDATTHVVRYDSNAGRIHEFTAPLFEGRAGAVHLGLIENRLRSIINTVTGQLLLTTLLVALLGIAAATLLTWALTRPILDLVATTRAVSQGNLAVRAPHWTDDEIGTLADAFNQMVTDLETSRAAIAEKDAARGRLLEKLITAQEEERKRIARELHDGVGQMLTSLMVGLRMVQRTDDLPTLHARAEELSMTAGETLEQVRGLSRELRPSLLDDLGLAAALERYVTEFTRFHKEIVVELHCDLPSRLPATVETALYRIVQEAMTNAARHGKANSIAILVNRRSATVQAIVEDNGVGFDVAQVRRQQSSVGIFGMGERAELVGGNLNIESGPDGTTVYVEVPL